MRPQKAEDDDGGGGKAGGQQDRKQFRDCLKAGLRRVTQDEEDVAGV